MKRHSHGKQWIELLKNSSKFACFVVIEPVTESCFVVGHFDPFACKYGTNMYKAHISFLIFTVPLNLDKRRMSQKLSLVHSEVTEKFNYL